MPSTFSANKGYELMADGENSGTWGQITNDNLEIVDLNLGGVQSLSLSSSNVTLTASQAQNVIFQCTGTLTANVIITWPSGDGGFFVVRNATSGAFTVSVRSGAGATLAVAQGTTRVLFTDGTTVREAVTLGTMAAQNANAVAITGGTITGITGSIGVGAADAVTGLNITRTGVGAGVGTIRAAGGDIEVGSTSNVDVEIIRNDTTTVSFGSSTAAFASNYSLSFAGTGAATTARNLLNGLGATKGQILYYNGSNWVVLAPPSSSSYLKCSSSGGPGGGNDIFWSTS